MKRTLSLLILAVTLCVLGSYPSVSFGDFNLLKGTGKVEAEKDKEYLLTDSDGLWLIMAKKFSGTEARKQANRLVYEIRKRYKLPAYIYRFDQGQNDLDQLSKNNKMSRTYRYQTPPPVEYAVLVGNFPSANDPKCQETLLMIKRSKPESLKNDPESQMLVHQFETLAKTDREYAGYGPLGGAMTVPNPTLPKDYFTSKGVVDSFIAKINSDSPYSLLQNPRMYTLRVATFGGKSMMENDSRKWDKTKSGFQDAGVKAAALCSALRKQGIEAWEFHDKDCSFVTIGSFDSYGTPNRDGTIEMNPEIYQLIEKYKGRLTGEGANYQAFTVTVELNAKERGKKIKMEIPFDLQPVVIMVPQLPENVKKIQTAQKKLQMLGEVQKSHHLEKALAAEDEIMDEFSKACRNSSPETLSEGEVMTDAEVAQMKAEAKRNAEGGTFAAKRPEEGGSGDNRPVASSRQAPSEVTGNETLPSIGSSEKIARQTPSVGNNLGKSRNYASSYAKSGNGPESPVTRPTASVPGNQEKTAKKQSAPVY